MKNVIVSIENLPGAVLREIQNKYPYGYDHEVFEFEMPTKNEIYEALRFSTAKANYIIKLSRRQKNIDNGLDLA